MSKKYGMVIDLKKCVGCGGCDLACKTENNTPDDIHWASHTTSTKGKFPDTKYVHMPTLCNHCDKPACVPVCPTKAMHVDKKTGMVLQHAEKCIGCLRCQKADPYGVISFNKKAPHQKWNDSKEIIPGCTSSGKEMKKKTKKNLPYENPERGATYPSLRPAGIVEKCTFCDHRVGENKLPHCVTACPANARIFGDINDSKSEVHKLLKKYKSKVLLPEKGTKPKVYYIREYGV